MFDKILLPTDGSDTSIAAAERAVALAKLSGAPLQVVFVQEPYPYAGVGAASPFGVQEYEAAAQRAALQAFERIRAFTSRSNGSKRPSRRRRSSMLPRRVAPT